MMTESDKELLKKIKDCLRVAREIKDKVDPDEIIYELWLPSISNSHDYDNGDDKE